MIVADQLSKGENMPLDHERALEAEMLEAAKSVADVAHVEKDPLLIILWRLNHQDRTLGIHPGEPRPRRKNPRGPHRPRRHDPGIS